MYNIYGFGRRVAALRKNAGLTQEDLAEKLNITAQAVSKWENEVSFPEITILPRLAQVLGTSIEELFGREQREPNGEGEFSFPEFDEHKLKLVHTFGNVGCYSDKEVEVSTGDTVIFKDGSSANLSGLEIVNKGLGDIRFAFAEERYIPPAVNHSLTELQETFEGIKSLELVVAHAEFSVTRSPDNKTRVSAQGTPLFLNNLVINQEQDRLRVKYRRDSIGVSNGTHNYVEIAFGSDRGEDLTLMVNGSSSAEVEIPFKKATVSVNGSGSAELADLDVLTGSVNGSGDLTCEAVGQVNVTVNGSGDVDIDQVSGDIKAQINGSGSIDFGRGEVDSLQIVVAGSGDVDAEGVTARTASLRAIGSGDVVVGRVIEESLEKHSRHATISVLKRG
ncbi:MAG: DUF2807 domain-containing protein [Bacillota bacterium]|jgi:transcriptional regulator with XRE-family HTH domain|nr:DUF2807 domain-containing protein [Bacillota bacterium]